jgi:serine/threonine protein kinase
MYKRVLEDRLEFPPEIPLSPDARDLISGLLDRHPQNRLCSDQIRQHPFFHSIDWDQLLSLQLRPPYLPYVRGDTDVSHFDEEFTQMTPRFSPAIRQQQQQLNCNGNHGNVGVVAVSSDDDSCGDGRCGCALHHHNDKHYEQQQEEDAFAGYSYLSSSAEAMMSANCASMPINNFTIDNNSKAIIVSEEPKAFVKRWAIKRRRGGSFGSIDGGDKAVSWQASPSIVPESWKIMRSSDINNSNNVNDGNGVTVSCGYVGGPSWRCRTTTIEEEPEYGGRSDDDELGFSMDL